MSKAKKLKDRINIWARAVKSNVAMIYLAYKDNKTPWYAKVMALVTVGYALSPIDLIPDFIPVLGYLDDALILPLLIWICLKIIPESVKEDCRKKADDIFKDGKPKSYLAACLIVLIWILIIYAIIKNLLR